MSIDMTGAVAQLANGSVRLYKDEGTTVNGRWVEGFSFYQLIDAVNQTPSPKELKWLAEGVEKLVEPRSFFLTVAPLELPRAILIGTSLYKVIASDVRPTRGRYKFWGTYAWTVVNAEPHVITEQDEQMLGEAERFVRPEG
jgi:hypothetical protein